MSERHCRIHGNYGFFLGSSGGCPGCKSDRADQKRDRENTRKQAESDRKRAREEASSARYQADRERERDREEARRNRERSQEEAQARRRDNDQRRNERQPREPRRSRQEERVARDDAYWYMQQQRDAAAKRENLEKEQKEKAEADRLVQETTRLKKEREDELALAERMRSLRSPEERARQSGYPPVGMPGYPPVGGDNRRALWVWSEKENLEWQRRIEERDREWREKKPEEGSRAKQAQEEQGFLSFFVNMALFFFAVKFLGVIAMRVLFNTATSFLHISTNNALMLASSLSWLLAIVLTCFVVWSKYKAGKK